MVEPWAIRSRRVATPTGVGEAAILIQGEKIVEVGSPDQLPGSVRVEDFGDLLVRPALGDKPPR